MSRPMRDNARVRDDLEEGRRAYARRAWRDAHDALSRADEALYEAKRAGRGRAVRY